MGTGMDIHLITWIMGVALTISLAFAGLMMQIFRSAMKDMKDGMVRLEHNHEKLQMLVNANTVSIAKFEKVHDGMKEIERDIKRLYLDFSPVLTWTRMQMRKDEK